MWDTAVGVRVPVQIHIKGKGTQKGAHSFEHVYNFFEFRPTLGADDEAIFEVRIKTTSFKKTIHYG